MTKEQKNKEEKDKNVNEAFELIQSGNQFEDSDDFWNASKRFVQASQILKDLSTFPNENEVLIDNNIPNDENQGEEIVSREKNEDEKILLLFKKESREYKLKAQKCFIQALQKTIESIKLMTNNDDAKSVSHDSIDLEDENDLSSANHKLSDKEKNNLFQQMFAPKLNNSQNHNENTVSNHDNFQNDFQLSSTIDTTDEKISTLEERLNALTIPQTLPSRLPNSDSISSSHQPNVSNKQDFETRLHLLNHNPSPYHNLPTSERLKKIHEGMERLGISISVNSNKSTNQQNYLSGTETMSEDDQVAWLLSAVKDELDLESRNDFEHNRIDVNSKAVDSKSISSKLDESLSNRSSNERNDNMNTTEEFESSHTVDNNFTLSEKDQVTKLLTKIKDEMDVDDENDKENVNDHDNEKPLVELSSSQKIDNDQSDLVPKRNDDLGKMDALKTFNSMDDNLMEEKDLETLSEDEQVAQIILVVQDELRLDSMNNNENKNENENENENKNENENENVGMDTKTVDNLSTDATPENSDDLGVEKKDDNASKTKESEPFQSIDEENNVEDSDDSQIDKVIDLIYQTQDLLLTAGSVLDGEEIAKDPKKRTESILTNANALILKAIAILKK